MLREKPSPAYRGWPRRGRVWRGPGANFRTAQKDDTPHIRHAKRRDTFSPGRRLFASPVRRMKFERAGHAAAPTFKIELPTAPHPATRKGGHLPPGEGESQKNERPPEAFASGGSLCFFTHSPTNNARNRSLFPGGCKFSAPGGSDRRPTHN